MTNFLRSKFRKNHTLTPRNTDSYLHSIFRKVHILCGLQEYKILNSFLQGIFKNARPSTMPTETNTENSEHTHTQRSYINRVQVELDTNLINMTGRRNVGVLITQLLEKKTVSNGNLTWHQMQL